MRAPRRFEFGLEFIPDQGMHGTISQRKLMIVRQVLLNLPITAKSLGLAQPRLEFVQDRRRDRWAFAGRCLESQERAQAPVFIEGQPRVDRMAMHGQELGQGKAGTGLATGH